MAKKKTRRKQTRSARKPASNRTNRTPPTKETEKTELRTGRQRSDRPKGRPAWADAFLEELRENGGHVRAAAAVVGKGPTTIYDPGFRSDALRRTLEGCGLAPTDVVLEISEQESISSFEIFREIRDYYGKLGFQIAMDDVGSGYASLESVMELSPEFIKVDRAFIAGIDEDPARQELLRALRAVSDQIGARIIGEGLDKLEELETLGRLGIPFGQGWLFGKPHPLRTDT